MAGFTAIAVVFTAAELGAAKGTRTWLTEGFAVSALAIGSAGILVQTLSHKPIGIANSKSNLRIDVCYARQISKCETQPV